MRYVIGCLALIGIVVVLVIGGCLGMIGFGISHMPKVPAYATRQFIEKRYAADLAIIDKAIMSDKTNGLADKVSDDVVAIIVNQDDILMKSHVTSKSYSTSNGVGAGTIQTNTKSVDCLVLVMQKGEKDYHVFLVDHGPPPGFPVTETK